MYNWRWREDIDNRPEFDQESAENQYRGWEDWLGTIDPDSDGGDSSLSSMDAELDRVHPNWTRETRPRSVAARLYAIGYEPPRISHHGREYSSDEDGDGPDKLGYAEPAGKTKIDPAMNRRNT